MKILRTEFILSLKISLQAVDNRHNKLGLSPNLLSLLNIDRPIIVI